jgi:hypothetical protein
MKNFTVDIPLCHTFRSYFDSVKDILGAWFIIQLFPDSSKYICVVFLFHKNEEGTIADIKYMKYISIHLKM